MAIIDSVYDVEMEGQLGHTCHVFVVASDAEQASIMVKQQFPELVTNGCVRHLGTQELS